MSVLEIILLIVGAGVIVLSFILSNKNDGPEKKFELTEKQKEDIKKQVMSAFDDQMEELNAKTEKECDRLAVQKMQEMAEYSENILSEINRNHNEVMFLYDMLNEKKKEVNNTVRDLNVVKKEIEERPKQEKAPEKATETTEKPAPKKAPAKTQKEKILDQLDASAETVADDVKADEEEVKPKRKKTSSGKTAATRAKQAIQKETEREDGYSAVNNNEKILALNAEGKSNVEIAKQLGIGIGEVKLVIDLFKGGK